MNLGAPATRLVNLSTYWYSMWSHRRDLLLERISSSRPRSQRGRTRFRPSELQALDMRTAMNVQEYNIFSLKKRPFSDCSPRFRWRTLSTGLVCRRDWRLSRTSCIVLLRRSRAGARLAYVPRSPGRRAAWIFAEFGPKHKRVHECRGIGCGGALRSVGRNGTDSESRRISFVDDRHGTRFVWL